MIHLFYTTQQAFHMSLELFDKYIQIKALFWNPPLKKRALEFFHF